MAQSKKHKLLKLAVSKVKMYDASHSHEPLMMTKPEPFDPKHYPSLSLNTKEAPSLSGYKVGDLCNLLMKVKIVSHNMHNTLNNKEDDYRLEIQSVGSADEEEKGEAAEPKDAY